MRNACNIVTVTIQYCTMYSMCTLLFFNTKQKMISFICLLHRKDAGSALYIHGISGCGVKTRASWDRRQSRLPGKFISGGRRTSSPQKKHILWSPRFALRKPARVLSTTKHNLDQWVLSGGGEIMLKTLKRGERWMPSMCNLLIKSHDKHDRTKKSSIVFSLVGQMLSS